MSEFKEVFRSRYLSHWQSLSIVQQSVIYHKSHKANIIFDVIFLATLESMDGSRPPRKRRLP
jgi:hypothetical protein